MFRMCCILSCLIVKRSYLIHYLHSGNQAASLHKRVYTQSYCQLVESEVLMQPACFLYSVMLTLVFIIRVHCTSYATPPHFLEIVNSCMACCSGYSSLCLIQAFHSKYFNVHVTGVAHTPTFCCMGTSYCLSSSIT